jgi:hypothetical protein
MPTDSRASTLKIPTEVKDAWDRLLANDSVLRNCARCGGTHPKMFWNAFRLPSLIEPDGTEARIYAMGYALCPKTDEPVVFQVQFFEGD